MKFRTHQIIFSVMLASTALNASAGDDGAWGPLSTRRPGKADVAVVPVSGQTDLTPAAPADLVDISNDLSALPDASLWQRIRSGTAIPPLDNATVREHEQYYASRPEYMYRMVERSRRYLYHIVAELDKRNMPLELAFLPMVESAYNPHANSAAHAAGIWQFMPSTGRNYGLEQTWLYDGRRDVLAATEAALDYLQYLYGLFGDWHLALAAYNWGEGAVTRSLAKNRAAGLPEDYSSINMPAETRNYVPKLLAMRNLLTNPEVYGLVLPEIPNRPYFSVVNAPHHMDKQIAAKLAGMSIEDFQSLNPGFNRPIVAYKPSRRLLVPVDKVESFSTNLASYDKPLLSWEPYTSQPGERYETIATRFSTSVARLRETNNIGNAKRAHGETLLVPRSDTQPALQTAEFSTALMPVAVVPAVPVYARLGKQASQPIRYKVRRGDSIVTVANRYDLSIAQLKTINGLTSNHLHVGQTLKVANAIERATPASSLAAASQATPASVAVIHQYTTKRGDTVYSISRRFNISEANLQKWNQLSGKNGLQAGKRLRIAPLEN